MLSKKLIRVFSVESERCMSLHKGCSISFILENKEKSIVYLAFCIHSAYRMNYIGENSILQDLSASVMSKWPETGKVMKKQETGNSTSFLRRGGSPERN